MDDELHAASIEADYGIRMGCGIVEKVNGSLHGSFGSFGLRCGLAFLIGLA